MRAYAGRFGEDPERWGMAGMLHDFDYEMHPRAPHHPVKGAEILLARGVDPDIVYAILSHADFSGMPRVSRLDRALYACDELTGFVHACALVRPGKVITGLEPASVRKKLKDKGFARTVLREDIWKGIEELGIDFDEHVNFVIEALKRDDVYRGAAELGVELDAHIAFVVDALATVAPEIGLARA
jgi:predicted hydrolase (HD superfamily)